MSAVSATAEPVPGWLHTALAVPATSAQVQVSSGLLHYRCWNEGDTHKPPLLLLHGFLGHSHWWDAIAPFLLGDWRVYALDLAGMGDSAPRSHYSPASFARDLNECVAALEVRPVTVVAHSYSCGRVVHASVAAAAQWSRAIFVDGYLSTRAGEAPPPFPDISQRRYRPDAETLLGSYRLVPLQPLTVPGLVEHVARHSIRETEAGWCWKFDPALRPDAEPDQADWVARCPIPVDVVQGEHSAVLSAERARRCLAALPRGRAFVQIPEAHHHVMLDAPLALVAVLRALLACPP
jgi:pimeloyl-ACP methyl ester carboxylesterase